MYRWFLLAALLAGASGCGLIDSDITQFNLSIPPRTFTIDTEQWNLDTGTPVFPTLPCSPDADMCSDLVAGFCPPDRCSGACVNDLCEMTVQVSLWRGVDLYMEKPELQALDDQPFIEVAVDRVNYQVEENTLNFDTPQIDLYVAPQTVMNPSDPQAQAVGSIPAVPAGSQIGRMNLLLTGEGEGELRAFMGDYRTPFNLIVGTSITIRAGDSMPQGRIATAVSVDAHAGL